MRRPVFSLLCALSLVVAAAVSALWIRSYRRGDLFWWTTYNQAGNSIHVRLLQVISGRGGVAVRVVKELQDPQGWIEALARGHISNEEPIHPMLHGSNDRPLEPAGFLLRRLPPPH